MVAKLLSTALLVVLLQVSAAQHPLTNLPPPGDISTVHVFPKHATKQFPAGDLIKTVVGIHNDGSQPYNISAIMGSLNSPFDFSMYIQNFTVQYYFQVVEPGEELAVEYVFRPDPILSPREFIVALTVFYEGTKNGYYSDTFFNETIDIVEMEKLVDTDLIFMYATIIGLLAVGGYFAYKALGNAGLIKKAKKGRAAAPTSGPTHDEDYLKGTPYYQQQVKKQKQAAAKTKAAETKEE